MKLRQQIIWLVLAITVVVLSATGCSALYNTASTATPTPDPNATTPPEQVVEADYKTYEEEDFSIQYHESWKIKKNAYDDENALDHARVVFTIPAGVAETTEASATVYPTLNVLSFDQEGENFDLKAYAEAQLADLRSEVYQFTLLKELQETQINGVPAYMLEYVGSVLNTNEVKVKQVFLAGETKVYILTYGANAGYYDQKDTYTAIAEKSIASFQLK